MKKFLYGFAIGIALFVATGCATTGTGMGVLPQTPEAQIKFGADTGKAVAQIGITLLKNDKITTEQADAYILVLRTAERNLLTMEATLKRCRAATSSTSASSPDPCKPGVIDVLNMTLRSIADVKNTLDGK